MFLRVSWWANGGGEGGGWNFTIVFEAVYRDSFVMGPELEERFKIGPIEIPDFICLSESEQLLSFFTVKVEKSCLLYDSWKRSWICYKLMNPISPSWSGFVCSCYLIITYFYGVPFHYSLF